MTPAEIEAIYDDEPHEVAKAKILPLAEAGDPVAQYFMGHLCDEPPRDAVAALEWYRRSSDAGFVEATHYVGSFLYHGMGVQRDVEAALVLFRKAAEAGNSGSQWALGRHLAHSPSTREDGLGWLRRSAGQGHSGAEDELRKYG